MTVSLLAPRSSILWNLIYLGASQFTLEFMNPLLQNKDL
jgi:hypothetical protein